VDRTWLLRVDAQSRRLVFKLWRRIDELSRYVYRDREQLRPFRMMRGQVPRAESPDLDDSSWKEFPLPGEWGAYLETFWFRTRFQIPDRFAGMPLCLHLIPSRRAGVRGADGMIYLDGRPRQGVQLIQVGEQKELKAEVLLDQDAQPDREYLLAIEAYSGSRPERHLFELAELVAVDTGVMDFYYDAIIALEAAVALRPESLERCNVLSALDDSLRLIDLTRPYSQTFHESLQRANELLKAKIYSCAVAKDVPVVACVGHGHIDIPWLWTVAQTRRKVMRTFSNSLRYMEQYPKYHFLASQAQLYAFLKHDCPPMYEEVRTRVREGRWEAPGGMWVEPDCNLTGGESLVRQFLFGKRFFKEELGVESSLMWFPDSFGYSASLPQIAARCGMKYFVSSKLALNDTNRFPYDSFWWEGIDGSRLRALLLTTPTPDRIGTYNGDLRPAVLKGCWDAYRHKDVSHEVLMAFGWGDGGGGPTREMLEAGRRLESFPGLPRCSMGTAQAFFERQSDRTDNLPVWKGELYLERHRGTLTSQGWVKRANRKNEILYHDAELLSSLAMFQGEDYPKEDLREGWEILLRNQFHDVLPGSALPEAFTDSRREHSQAQAIGERLRDKALSALARRASLPSTPKAMERAVTVWNTLSWSRTDLASLPLDGLDDVEVLGEDGLPLIQQVVETGSASKSLLFLAADVPSMGCRTFRLRRRADARKEAGSPPGDSLSVSASRLANKFFDLSLDEAGAITSLLDKRANRQVLPSGTRANILQVFQDKPVANSAWDLDRYLEEKMWEPDTVRSAEVVEHGPLRASVSVSRAFLNSTIHQTIYSYRDIPRIDFHTTVDWHQSEILMKVAFPVDILSRFATYEIQFGNIERPTHRNTSYDQAKFEVCAHKWIDLSESGYGVSLLNDCKYGHDVRDNVMRITLLRSPTAPDPKSDRGKHVMVYSLYPHPGGWREAGTVRQAYELNYPLLSHLHSLSRDQLPPAYSFVSTSQPNVIVETVKCSEEGNSIVVRLYECFGMRGPVTLNFGATIRTVWESTPVERKIADLSSDDTCVSLYITPYEIRTLMMDFD